MRVVTNLIPETHPVVRSPLLRILFLLRPRSNLTLNPPLQRPLPVPRPTLRLIQSHVMSRAVLVTPKMQHPYRHPPLPNLSQNNPAMWICRGRQNRRQLRAWRATL